MDKRILLIVLLLIPLISATTTINNINNTVYNDTIPVDISTSLSNANISLWANNGSGDFEEVKIAYNDADGDVILFFATLPANTSIQSSFLNTEAHFDNRTGVLDDEQKPIDFTNNGRLYTETEGALFGAFTFGDIWSDNTECTLSLVQTDTSIQWDTRIDWTLSTWVKWMGKDAGLDIWNDRGQFVGNSWGSDAGNNAILDPGANQVLGLNNDDSNRFSTYGMGQHIGQWVHVAVSWNFTGLGGVRWYINGEFVSSQPYVVDGVADDTSFVMAVGKSHRNQGSPSTCLWFNGTIDEVLHWKNKVLSDDEIRRLYTGDEEGEYCFYANATIGTPEVSSTSCFSKDLFSPNINSTLEGVRIVINGTEFNVTASDTFNTSLNILMDLVEIFDVGKNNTLQQFTGNISLENGEHTMIISTQDLSGKSTTKEITFFIGGPKITLNIQSNQSSIKLFFKGLFSKINWRMLG